MTAPPPVRNVQRFSDRASALGTFFQQAGEAPRIVAYDEEAGCALHNSLAALEFAVTLGILEDSDLIHAARLTGEVASAMVERRREGKRVFVYMGPRVDAPPPMPHEGRMLYDQPGVRAFEFVQRAHAVAHFLRATQGVGSMISMLSRRAPELIHVKRWLGVLFQNSSSERTNILLSAWFATTGAGFLFAPGLEGADYVYEELGST